MTTKPRKFMDYLVGDH